MIDMPFIFYPDRSGLGKVPRVYEEFLGEG